MATWYDSALKSLKQIGDNFQSLVQSGDQRFGYAMIESLALVTMADGRAEDEEVQEVTKYLTNVPEISSAFQGNDAINLYNKTLVDLQNAFSANLPIILDRIQANCKEEPHKQSLIGACISLAKVHEIGPLERDMINKIADKIDVSVDWDRHGF